MTTATQHETQLDAYAGAHTVLAPIIEGLERQARGQDPEVDLEGQIAWLLDACQGFGDRRLVALVQAILGPARPLEAARAADSYARARWRAVKAEARPTD